MAASENIKVTRRDGELGNIPLAATEVAYIGTLLYVSAGGYGNATAAGSFGGVVYEYGDNSAGADGDVAVDVWQDGQFEFAGSGFTQADLNAAAFGTDNNTVATTGTVRVGTIKRVISATRVEVLLDRQQ